MRLLVVCIAALIAAAGSAEAANRLTWGSVVTRTAQGCDAFTPVRGPDGHHYTSFGDCNGLSGTLARMSMGLGRIIGGPGSAQVQDLPTPDLTDYGSREPRSKAFKCNDYRRPDVCLGQELWPKRDRVQIEVQ